VYDIHLREAKLSLSAAAHAAVLTTHLNVARFLVAASFQWLVFHCLKLKEELSNSAASSVYIRRRYGEGFGSKMLHG
jgi:hypothetical protein